MRFFCITDRNQTGANRSLKAACEARDIEYVPAWTNREAPRPEPGDLLFRVAPSWNGVLLEQVLFQPGVATFYVDDRQPHLSTRHQVPLFASKGLPVVDVRFTATDVDPTTLRKWVDDLGGFPLVIKVPGRSSGIGVIRVDTWGGLVSTLDYVKSRGSPPALMRWFDLVSAWRTVVVGDEVVDTMVKTPSAQDFRTNAAESEDLGQRDPSAAIVDISVRAAHAVGWEFGGVDILEDAVGNLVLTEVNNPCFFSRQEQVTGVDISGRMIDHLAEKARRIA